MADRALFTTITYQRQPGLWRTAISRKDRAMISLDGAKAEGNVVTPIDCLTEIDAEKAAADVIKRL